MDGATSFMQMGDRDGSWICGDETTVVEASWTNTGWSRHNPLASDSDVATQRRWLTERGAVRDVAAWANDKQKLDGEIRRRWRLRRTEGDCRRRSQWREERQGRRQPCDFEEEEDESGGLRLR
uniref:Uncharacterized protein n=1 Tax=Cucumis melo TaxID=3656 RepID=A0A9I9DJK5_CUCME